MKKTLLAMAATLSFGYAHAQIKVGSNPTTVNSALNLEVEATNGAKLAVDKATGKVGIGTTTPTDMLTVRNSTTQPVAMVSNGGNAAFSALIGVKHEGVRNGYLGIDPASKNLFLLNYGSGTLDQGNNTNLKSSLVLTDNGAVGIGTVTPLTRLHVNNGFTSGLTATFSNAALTLTGSSLPRIYWENPTNTTGQRVMSAVLTTAGALNFDALSDNAGTVLTPSILTLTNSGKVGIGTSTPTDMLSVRNSTIQPIATVSNGANTANTPLIGVKDEGVRNAYLGVDPTSHSLFLLNYGSGTLDMGNNGILKSSLVMTDLGNVGIGTTAPTAKLEVAGADALINGVTVGTGLGSGNTNTAFGNSANTGLAANASVFNTSVGYQAFQTSKGNSNTAVGYQALKQVNPTLNNAGSNNTAVGKNAMTGGASGTDANFGNTGIGSTALEKITDAQYNTATGYQTLNALTTGDDNIAYGHQAGNTITTGSGNIAIGKNAQVPTATADNQLSIGNTIYGTGIGTATSKIGIGTAAPKNFMHILTDPAITSNITTSYVRGMTITGNGGGGYSGPGFYLENTDNPVGKKLFKINYTANGGSEGYMNFQSVSDDASASVASEIMAITHSGRVGIGISTPTATLHVVGTTLAAAWSTSSDARLKTNIVGLEQGLNKVMQLQPVSYDKKETLESANYNKKETGFIAQDLRKVLPNMIQENGADKLLSINYTELIPVLTKAIQEQQAQIEALKKENVGLKASMAKVSELESQMSALNAKMELFLKANATTTVVGGGK